MKTKLKILLMILISTVLTAQEFPVGVYINTTADKRPNTNYNEVKAMGVNWVFERADDSTKSNLDSLFVIAANADSPADVIHHYSGAYYTKWEAEDNLVPDNNQPGVRHEAGIAASGYWSAENDDIILEGDNVVCGPYYVQARKYNLGYKQNSIFYNVNFNMRLTGNVSSGTPICSLLVTYTILKKESGVYVQYSDTLADSTLYAYDLSDDFADYQLTYRIPKEIESKSTLMDYPDLDILDPTTYPPYGVRFIVEWLDDGHRGVLDIDYIEVYDDQIWPTYLADSSSINQSIRDYADKSTYTNWDELQYWAGVDEPSYIDQYEPYRIVNDLLTSNGNPGLISAVYPNYDGKRNWEIATKRFLDIVEPDKLLYDYYPFWTGKTNDQGLKTQQITIQRMFDDTDEHKGYFNNCFFLAQAHAFWNWDADDSVSVPFKRWPNNAMLRANVMLALAHGSKGIFFWNYFSYLNPDDTYRCLGIVDINNVKSELYYEIKDTLAPRLKGALGDTLSNIDYTTDFEYKKINVVDDSNQPNASVENIPFVEILNTNQNTDTLNFHIGLLENPSDAVRKYLMIGNMNCAVPTKSTDLILGISNPLSKYVNYSFINIESQFNYNKTVDLSGASTFIDTITFSAGDGHLYELKPVLKYGGNLVYDDTVKTAISLTDEMTIKPNADLVVEALYTVDSDIYVEAGGTIKVNSYDGNVIVTSNGSIEFETWDNSLIGAKTSNDHPRLIWQNYPEPVEHYKIHRKYGSQQWNNNYATTSNNNFTDQNITINAPGSTAGIEIKYKVSAVYYIGKVLGADESDEVNYQAEGSEIEKKGSENNNVAKPTKFALEQNHPNPFNPTTVMTYQIPELSHVTIKVYDILGKEIAELVNTRKEAGFYSVKFDAANLSSGTYIYKMEAGKYVESRKMIILK